MDILITFIFQPLFNALMFFYNLLGDMGLAIIAVTLIIRVLLLPLSNKALRSQRRLQALQPELKKLQEKHKDDREALAKEMMGFYKKEGVNPASSCLPTLLQVPILIALFFVFKDAVAGQHLNLLYSFIDKPAQINPTFLGLVDLSDWFTKHPNRWDLLLLPALAGALQYVQSRMLLPKNGDTSGLPGFNQQLVYLFPIITFAVYITLPAALPLYWAVTTLTTIIQQYVIIKEMPLATAKAEAVADWNAANPGDPVGKPKRLGAGKTAKRGKSKGPQVTVRQRRK